MKHRIVRLTWFTAVLGLVAPPLVAERNVIPSLESVPDVCPERPTNPVGWTISRCETPTSVSWSRTFIGHKTWSGS